jgi:hypothetical protein
VGFDNRLFNVNGRGEDQLLAALKLAFSQEGSSCKAWSQTRECGLILHWWDSDGGLNKLPGEMTPEDCLPIVLKWLGSDFASTVEPSEWCGDADHDGSNSIGWQVYVGDWGHVGASRTAICAVKPAYLWHGK